MRALLTRHAAIWKPLLGIVIAVAAMLACRALSVHVPAPMLLAWAAIVRAAGPSPVARERWLAAALIPALIWLIAAVLTSTLAWAMCAVIVVLAVLAITRQRECTPIPTPTSVTPLVHRRWTVR
jgi:hypothetical protein